MNESFRFSYPQFTNRWLFHLLGNRSSAGGIIDQDRCFWAAIQIEISAEVKILNHLCLGQSGASNYIRLAFPAAILQGYLGGKIFKAAVRGVTQSL